MESNVTKSEILDLKRQFIRHGEQNETSFLRLHDTMENIRDNHLKHIYDDINEIKSTVAKVETDVSWLKKNQWFIITSSVGSFLTVMIAIIMYLIKR